MKSLVVGEFGSAMKYIVIGSAMNEVGLGDEVSNHRKRSILL